MCLVMWNGEGGKRSKRKRKNPRSGGNEFEIDETKWRTKWHVKFEWAGAKLLYLPAKQTMTSSSLFFCASLTGFIAENC